MIYVINNKPELELYIQELSLDKSSLIRAGALYQTISVGDKFDCVFDLGEESIVKMIKAKVNSILFRGESALQLPKGRSGEIGISAGDKELEWLKGALRTKKLLLASRVGIDFNIYSKNVVSLEPAKNNIQVQKLFPRLGLEPSNYNMLFIAKAIRSDVSLNDEFDLIWDLDRIEMHENSGVRIKAIYSKNLQPGKKLYRGEPTLILLSKSINYINSEADLKLLSSESSHLMIGKRVVPSMLAESDKDLPI